MYEKINKKLILENCYTEMCKKNAGQKNWEKIREKFYEDNGRAGI